MPATNNQPSATDSKIAKVVAWSIIGVLALGVLGAIAIGIIKFLTYLWRI